MPSRCGDGIVDRDGGENCDDGNTNDTDACNNACTRACGGAIPSCDDNDPCNGVESCVDGLCDAPPTEPDGTICRFSGKGATCFDATCIDNP